jgi:hypothetical protein
MIPSKKRAHKPKTIFDPSEDRFPDDDAPAAPKKEAKSKSAPALAPKKTIDKKVAAPACVMNNCCSLTLRAMDPRIL